MDYAQTKIYFDGSHYVGVPKINQPWKKKKPKLNKSKEIEVKKQKFETLYKENSDKKKKEKIEAITKELKEDFKSEEQAKEFVKNNLARKKRNAIVRKTRLMRKLNLQEWTHFCTFTYDENKLNEEEFKKKLSNCFKKLCHRKEWKYIGVWERSPTNNRLHFHGIFYIPNMVGELIEIKDYSTKKHQMQVSMQNTYFLERFGRNDFKELDQSMISNAATYLMKYIEKTGEKLVYSRGLATYFVSDILEDDIVCTIGQEDRKILLFDDFYCLDQGVLIGKVSKEVIKQMPKAN